MAHSNVLNRGPRLSDRVARRLAEAIETGQHRPGERFPPERELTERFGVSRMVIREAMSRLKAEGLVESRQGLGAFVASEPGSTVLRIRAESDDQSDLRDLFELRLTIETKTAALAAERASPSDLASIEAALEEMRADVAAGRDGIGADTQFHLAIAAASKNAYFPRFISFLGARLRGSIYAARKNTATRFPDRVRGVLAEHEAVFAAIVARDSAAAERAMQDHLTAILARMGF
jgi:GntR family transcriptional repressor for pyruvate dehydrogenase complex